MWKKHRGQCCEPKRQKTAIKEGGKKYKGFNTNKKIYNSIRMSVLYNEERKRKKPNNGDKQWIKDTTPAQRAYMIRETGADGDSSVNLNSLSKKRLQELKRDAKNWCNDNGLWNMIRRSSPKTLPVQFVATPLIKTERIWTKIRWSTSVDCWQQRQKKNGPCIAWHRVFQVNYTETFH